jgi:hypothetical protein
MIRVLILRTKTSPTERIKDLLKNEGIRTFTTPSICRMHDLLEGHGFDAVIIERGKLERHCVQPMKHLWESLSSIIIVYYSITETGFITAECASIPPSELSCPIRVDRGDVERIVVAALKGKAIEQAEPAPTEFPPAGSVRPELHQKMEKLLDLLLEAGSTGIAPAVLAEAILNHRGDTWKKDIQSYVSKLRSVLARQYSGQYSLTLRNTRYTLIKIPQSV